MATICAPNKLGCKSSTRQAPQEPLRDTHTERTRVTEVRRCFSDWVELCCDWPTASSNAGLKCQGLRFKCLRSDASVAQQRCHSCGHRKGRGDDTLPAQSLSPPHLASSSVLPIPACVRDGRCLLAGCQVTGLIERSPESHRSVNPPLFFFPSSLQLSFQTETNTL